MSTKFLSEYFGKVWYILGDAKKQVPLLLMVFILTSIAETLGIGLLGPFFVVVSDPDSVENIPLLRQLASALNIRSNEMLVVLLCVLISLIFVIKSILYFFSKFYILKFSHAHRGKMVETLNHAYLQSDYSYFISKNSSALIKNISVETQIFCQNVLLSLLYAVSNLLILSFLFSLMALTDTLLLVVTLLALLPVLIIVFAMKTRLSIWGRTLSESARSIIKTLNHGLGGFKETRTIGCARYFDEEMASHTQQYVRAAALSRSFEMLPRILIETVLFVFVISFVGVSYLFALRSIDSLIASLSVFAMAAIRLLPAASQVMSALGMIPNTEHLVNVLYSDLRESQNHSLELASYGLLPSDSLDFKDSIKISNLTYRYSEHLAPAIDGVTLEIRRGESIAFIGQSGAGKTTLVDTILGLLVPQIGDIQVDGKSIYSSLRCWQNLIGYIPQSIFLLDDTVRRNIAFGVPDSSIDVRKLEDAISAAQLKELMLQLPDGIETRVGERGVMLSGGQRQRIGIARALYHEREILVLDEATSALDSKTEQQVSAAIRNLSETKTVIIIAHRLSTVEHCDQVYLLEKGKVIQSGSYAEVVNA